MTMAGGRGCRHRFACCEILEDACLNAGANSFAYEAC